MQSDVYTLFFLFFFFRPTQEADWLPNLDKSAAEGAARTVKAVIFLGPQHID